MSQPRPWTIREVKMYAESIAVFALILLWTGDEQGAAFGAIMSACYGMLWVAARREEKTREC